MAHGRAPALVASIVDVSSRDGSLGASTPTVEVVEPPEAEPQVARDLQRATPRVTVIRPAPRWPHLDVPELWHYRELLFRLAWRDVAVRYKQTWLGVAWAVLVPTITAFIYVIVFGKFANFPSGGVPYPQLVLAGLLPMQYFTSSLAGSSMSLVANLSLVTKVYFPRVLLPLAARFSFRSSTSRSGSSYSCRSWWYFDSWPGGLEALAAPLFVALALVTALGAGLLLSAVNVRYRDVPYLLPLADRDPAASCQRCHIRSTRFPRSGNGSCRSTR